MDTYKFVESLRTVVRWPVAKFVNWLRLLDNIEDCPASILVPAPGTKTDAEITARIAGLAVHGIPICPEGIVWRSRKGRWHKGRDSFDSLLARIRDERYHQKVNINVTISGRLHWRNGGIVLSNCRVVVPE